jgi:hypothetical protein
MQDDSRKPMFEELLQTLNTLSAIQGTAQAAVLRLPMPARKGIYALMRKGRQEHMSLTEMTHTEPQEVALMVFN